MSPDLPSVPPPRAPLPDLVLATLPEWRQILAEGPIVIGGEIERVDSAGLQFIAAALRASPGRVRLELSEASAAAALWRGLGLHDPADAEVVVEEGCVVALRPWGDRQ